MGFAKDGRGWKSAPATGDLAAICRCEVEYVMARQHGEKKTAHRQARSVVGEREHDQFHQATIEHHNAGLEQARRQAQADKPTDRRCFIASHLYGPDDARTHQLRAWRDAVLLPTPAGRLAVYAYYATAPMMVSLLQITPWAVTPARWGIDLFRKIVVAQQANFGQNVTNRKEKPTLSPYPARARRGA